MIREFITIDDFQRISTENEYFIWNFIREDILTNGLDVTSYFYINSKFENPLSVILKKVQIPYFESFTNESTFDFLKNLGFNPDILWVENEGFRSILIGFNRDKKVSSTLDLCYCLEGVIHTIYTLNPKFILESDFD